MPTQNRHVRALFGVLEKLFLLGVVTPIGGGFVLIAAGFCDESYWRSWELEPIPAPIVILLAAVAGFLFSAFCGKWISRLNEPTIDLHMRR